MAYEIRVLILGAAGEQGRHCTRILTQHGTKIVAAVGRNRFVGEDLGELHGVGPIGVPIQRGADLNLGELIDETRANVAIECIDNLGKTFNLVKTCVEHGVNVLLMGGVDPFYPRIQEPELFARLDALAKEHNVTIVGTGIPDVNFVNVPVVLSANAGEVHSVTIDTVCILDHAGATVWEDTEPPMGINCTEEEFYELHKDDPKYRGSLVYALYVVAEELGLHVTEEINVPVTPILATDDYSNQYVRGGTIFKEHVIGLRMDSDLITEEEITISARFAYVFRQGYDDYIRWIVDGTPSFQAEYKGGDLGYSTSTILVQRIPDVINAAAGYLAVNDLPKPRYKHGDLNKYVADGSGVTPSNA